MSQNEALPKHILIPFFGLEKPLIGIEIGVLCGTGSIALLNLMPNLNLLYCIDPWKHLEGHDYEAEREQEYHDKNYEIANARLKTFGKRAIILKMTSDEAVKEIKEKVQFVHIDGDHRYVQVKKDIENYLPLIKEDGIMSGHDYKQAPGVTRAVDEKFGDKVKLENDFLWWVRL